MTARYEELSGFAPESESDIMLRLRVLAGEIYKERAYADYILRQMFPTTAQGTYLEEHAAQRNLSRKNATKAEGRVTFTAASEEHGDILIPEGTVVSTMTDSLRFTTDSDCTLSSASQTVSVSVTASQGGSAYNVGSGQISLIVTPVLGIASVRNAARLSGGSDTESDEELRQRVADSYKNISNGTNAAYYRSAALSVDGVYSASAVGMGRGAGTVDVYVCAKGAALPSETIARIQSLMDDARELNVDVKVFNAAATNVNLYIRLAVEDGYTFSEVADEVQTSVTDYINALGIGRDVLLSNIGDIIYHIKGVSDYRFLESYGSDQHIPDSRYAVANNILVRSE